MRRHRAALALVAWTFLIWTTRIANIWRDDELDTAGRLGRTALALVLTVLAAAVVAAVWRRSPAGIYRTVSALVAATVGVWLIRGTGILLGDHEVGFKVVHAVLAAVSIALAVLAAIEADRRRTADRTADHGAGAAAAVSRGPAAGERSASA